MALPRLVDTLARMVGISERMPHAQRADELVAELALTLDSQGLQPGELPELGRAWGDQLAGLLTAASLELDRAHQRRQAAEVKRRSDAARRGHETRKANKIAQGLFDGATLPHDWHGIDEPIPGGES